MRYIRVGLGMVDGNIRILISIMGHGIVPSINSHYNAIEAANNVPSGKTSPYSIIVYHANVSQCA